MCVCMYVCVMAAYVYPMRILYMFTLSLCAILFFSNSDITK